LKGADLSALATPILFLVVYAIAVVFLAARAFHKTLD